MWFRKLMCKLGWHEWIYESGFMPMKRECQCCKKKQLSGGIEVNGFVIPDGTWS